MPGALAGFDPIDAECSDVIAVSPLVSGVGGVAEESPLPKAKPAIVPLDRLRRSGWEPFDTIALDVGPDGSELFPEFNAIILRQQRRQAE